MKCPFYGQCTIDAELLASVGEEDKPSQRFRYESIRCKGEGRPSEQWKECDNYLVRRSPSDSSDSSISLGSEQKENTDQSSDLLKKSGQIAKFQGYVSAGTDHMIFLRADGTVVVYGKNEDDWRSTANWRDIIAVSSGAWHTVGLKRDGTVVAVGDNKCNQCNTADWRNIVAISAGVGHTVGLKADGTVVAVGANPDNRCNTDDWRGITAIAAGILHTAGLKADGTVVAVGNNEYNQCDTDQWQDIVAISANMHTVGVKANGTVVAVGVNAAGQCDIGSWHDIIAVSAGVWHTVGLKANGKLVAVGRNSSGQCNITGCQAVVAISAADTYTVFMNQNGLVAMVGNNMSGRLSDERFGPASAEKIFEEQSTGGCYVATCVYGSYDCPEVWTLRRFRDDTLQQSWIGRRFIDVYYAVSPRLVERFGNTRWFNKLLKPIIGKIVIVLQSK